MPGISERAITTQLSPIRKLKPLADQAIAAGKKIYNLNIGQPDIHTPKSYLEGIMNPPNIIAYGPSEGLPEARTEVAKYYAQNNIPLKSADIFITNGGSEAISFALMAICDPGDEILVPEPFYTNYSSFAAMANVKIMPIETLPETGFALPDREHIESRISEKTKAILFCSPGNPTGAIYSRDELEMLKEVALKHDLYLISDEVYREFVYDGLSHTSVLHLEGIDDRAIIVDSISKRISACGARVGVIGSKNKDLMKAVLKFAQARLCAPTVEQLGLISFLRDPNYQSDIDDMIAEFNRRRDVVFEEAQKIPSAKCQEPPGSFYVILKLPVKNAETFCGWLLTDFEVDNETVMLSPAEDFYQTPGKGMDEVRIAYVLNEDDLKKAMHILDAGLATYAKQISSSAKVHA
jgi:aspartate aminotransferase